MNRLTTLALGLMAFGLAGCRFDEELEINNMTGKIVLPREAATRVMHTPDGDVEVTDVRLIGPVYLGLYASVQAGQFAYPHPEMGPIYQQGVAGDTNPYGGTTVGDFPFGCLDFFTCKLVSGRYADLQEVVDWFNYEVNTPIIDQYGIPVTSADYFRQTCYDQLYYTTDEELRITPSEDKNGDGEIGAADLDFIERSDGNFEAVFTIWQQDYYDGFSLWGYMDSPSEVSYQMSTCDPDNGYQEYEYTTQFAGGRQYPNVLNTPSSYIAAGDWVATEGHVYQEFDDEVELWLDFPVEE